MPQVSRIEDQPRWPWGRFESEKRRLGLPTAQWSTFIDLNARHPVVVAFGKYVLERFVTDADAKTMVPLRARIEISRGHDWGQAFGLARDNLRDGITSWRTCVHPPPRVSEAHGLHFCRACASWQGSAGGTWEPPLGVMP